MIEEALRGESVRQKEYYQEYAPKIDSEWMLVFGLIVGVGFAVLGYCPGTLLGAAAQGSLDALAGGACGMLLGAGIYAALYPRLARTVLKLGDFGQVTFPELLEMSPWSVIAIVGGIIVVFLGILEISGF